MGSSWNHDGDPVELLQISESVSQFKRALKENPRFLQDKVKHYFTVNKLLLLIARGEKMATGIRGLKSVQDYVPVAPSVTHV